MKWRVFLGWKNGTFPLKTVKIRLSNISKLTLFLDITFLRTYSLLSKIQWITTFGWQERKRSYFEKCPARSNKLFFSHSCLCLKFWWMLQWLHLKTAVLEMCHLCLFFFLNEAMESFLIFSVQCYSKSYANKINTGSAHISQFPGST